MIGKGGREHALCWRTEAIVAHDRGFLCSGQRGNSDRRAERGDRTGQSRGLLQFARREGIGLTVVGPEEPLAKGIVDVLSGRGCAFFGPRRTPPSWKVPRSSPRT